MSVADHALRLCLRSPGSPGNGIPGRPARYVSIHTHDGQFHAVDGPWEALTFASGRELAKWVSEQGVVTLAALAGFDPAPWLCLDPAILTLDAAYVLPDAGAAFGEWLQSRAPLDRAIAARHQALAAQALAVARATGKGSAHVA